jgi:hypothetical protein
MAFVRGLTVLWCVLALYMCAQCELMSRISRATAGESRAESKDASTTSSAAVAHLSESAEQVTHLDH